MYKEEIFYLQLMLIDDEIKKSYQITYYSMSVFF